MPSSSIRPGPALMLGVLAGCALGLLALGPAPAQTPEPKVKHAYTLQYIKLPSGDGEIAGLAGCKSVSLAPVTHGGEAQLAALCEK